MKKQSNPWHPPDYELADAAAIQALRKGDADEFQQQRAISYILEVLCDRNGMSYRPGADGDRDTAFAEGRRFVGNQIVKLSIMPLGKLRKEK